jgi:hypothetical protein
MPKKRENETDQDWAYRNINHPFFTAKKRDVNNSNIRGNNSVIKLC